MWEPHDIEDVTSEHFPYRSRGRPFLNWDSAVRKFCILYHNQSWQKLPIDVLRGCTDNFVRSVCNCAHVFEVAS